MKPDRTKETLEIVCRCGHYNVVPSIKVFLKFRVLDEKQGRVIKGLLPAYKVSDVVRCEKCGMVIARAGESFRPRTQNWTFTKHEGKQGTWGAEIDYVRKEE